MAQYFEVISGEYNFDSSTTLWHFRDDEGKPWCATGLTPFRFEGLRWEAIEGDDGLPTGEQRMVCPRAGIISADATWRRERGN